jgi:uncharacterized protein DUF2442
MSELRIKSVSFSGEMMIVRFSDGREIFVPMGYFPRLEAANTTERERWSLIGRGLGVHWDAVDEDLSVENILTAYSRHQRAAYAHAAGA